MLPSGNSHWNEPFFISDVVNEVDHIIYLARVSAHVISDITSGLKIGVGFLREDSRRMMHSGGEDFFALYEEINEVPEIKSKLRLTVTSGRSLISLWGPDAGYITEPDYGNVFASENLLAHELYAYAWLQYNREKLTPGYLYSLEKGARALINMRTKGNRSFVKKIWQDDQEVPDIPAYQPGDIYLHPSIANSLQRLGGSQGNIIIKEINSNPDFSVRDYLQKQLMLF